VFEVGAEPPARRRRWPVPVRCRDEMRLRLARDVGMEKLRLKERRSPGPQGLRKPGCLFAALIGAVVLSGCTSGALPPVFGAVFGLSGAEVAPFRVGRIPETVVTSDDRVLGLAANNPGQCIYLSGQSNRRFRAACPEGFKV